jgi:hypothetical protein
VNNTAVARPPDLNERILVRELTHRINNQLTSAINVVTAAAVRTDHLEAKAALGNAVELLQEAGECASCPCDSGRHYAYGRSYASSDDGCHYVSTYRRYGTRRTLVCHGN